MSNTQVSKEANPLERWPGYDEQSWSERFAELDRQYRDLQNALFAMPETIQRAIDQSALAEREAWSDNIEDAPAACHVLAARFDFDCGEWVCAVVASPPSKPFTHWRMIYPPAIRERKV